LKRLLFCLLVFFTLGVTPGQSQSCQSCVLVTDPSASQAFSAGNGAAVNLNNCGLHVDSSSSTALSVIGGATVKASSIQVVGGYSINNGGSATPTPVTGASVAADPFATIPAPAIGTCLSHPDYTQWGQTGSYEVYPGTYCGGLAVSKRGDGTFQSGCLHHQWRRNPVWERQCQRNGRHVLHHWQQLHQQPVSHDQQRNVGKPVGADLGTYQGILFLQDRTISNTALGSSFGGGASMALVGALDFPTTTLTFNNGATSTANVAIVARTISLQGGVGVKLNSSSPVLPGVSVTVTPATAVLYGGQTQQFTSAVANGCTPGVTWTVSPATGAGTISAAGLYTAPATITAQQTVTITAKSTADTTKSGHGDGDARTAGYGGSESDDGDAEWGSDAAVHGDGGEYDELSGGVECQSGDGSGHDQRQRALHGTSQHHHAADGNNHGHQPGGHDEVGDGNGDVGAAGSYADVQSGGGGNPGGDDGDDHERDGGSVDQLHDQRDDAEPNRWGSIAGDRDSERGGDDRSHRLQERDEQQRGGDGGVHDGRGGSYADVQSGGGGDPGGHDGDDHERDSGSVDQLHDQRDDASQPVGRPRR